MLALIGLVPWRAWLVGAVVAGALGTVVYFHHEWIAEGYNKAIGAITDANNAEKKKADQGQQTVDDCYNAGGTWDRSNGVCVNAPSK